MAEYKINRNLVSPARQFSQDISDLERQQSAGVGRGIPRFAPEDVRNSEPKPTLYNQNTGEWDDATSLLGRLMGVPIGPAVPSPEVINRMWNPPNRMGLEKIEPEKIA